MKKKILIIHPSLGLGGAEKIIAFLATSLVGEYDVNLLLLKEDENTISVSKEINIKKINCYSNLPVMGIHVITGLRNLKYMSKIIKTEFDRVSPELLICFDLRVLLSSYYALPKKHERILFSERADPYYNKKYWQFILKRIYKDIGFIVFQTEGARSFYGKNVESKNCIIPNPALNRDLNTSNIFIENKLCYIFAAGRLQYRKGFDLLIDAFSEISSDFPEIKVYIYGDGKEKNELLKKIKFYNLEDIIVVKDPVPNIIEKNRDAKLFILPSRSEGIPNILIEAMMAKIPIVTTNCSPGGAEMLTENGKFGLLATNNNSHSLAQKIRFALEHENDMKLMTELGYKSLGRFNPKYIEEKWKNVIEKQIEKNEKK